MTSIVELEKQVEALLQQIEDLKKQRPKDVHVAARATKQFIDEHGFPRELTENNMKVLRKIAKDLGYQGKDSALRTSFLFRKYWVQMEERDWS